MPYKDKKKQIEYKQQWNKDHKESINKYQQKYLLKHKETKFIEKYHLLVHIQ